jgi:CRP-like cAMP-binding protein
MIHLERILTLRKSSLFDSVSLEKVSILAESLTERSFSNSDFILKEGDDCPNLFVVAKGSARVSFCGMDSTVSAGGFFGELGVFHSEPLPLVASAEEDVLVFEIDGDSYRKVLAEEFDVAENLLRALVRQIISLAEQNRKETL